MDRNIVYPAAIPLDTDLLSTNRNTMLALGFLAQATLGTATVVDGLACTPTAPPSLTVNVGPGSILGLSTVDATPYGSLPADPTDPLVKMGINLTSTSFTLTAPNTSGQSTNYLLEAAFEETDTTPVVLPYYNAANPAQPYTGPNNSGTAQNTLRIQRVQLQLKPGAPANAGSQQTPPADTGWVGLYIVTVNYGQTQLTAANIVPVPSAPFIPFKLAQLTPGVSRLAYISNSENWPVPPGVNMVRLRLWGGGGGGGAGGSSAGGGGAGGGYSEGYYSVTPGSDIAVAIGQGGNAGSSGGTTSFGALATATGGSAGAAGTSSSTTGVGGTSAGTGTGSNSSYWAVAGTQGQNGIIIAGGYMGGAAGTAFGGGVAWGPAGSSNINGNSGQVPGAGGSGGIGSGSGGQGAPGLAILEW